MMRKVWLGLLALVFLTAGCGQRQCDEENLAIFKYNESAGILTLDPIYAKDLPHIWACNQVFNSLVAFDNQMNVVPMVAKSWDISEDGLIYTFHLRDDVRFHEDECFQEGATRLDCFVPRKSKIRRYEVSQCAKRQSEAKVPEPVEGPTLSYQLLFEWLRNYGFNTDQCHFIFEAMQTGIGNKYYSPTHQLVIGRNELLLSEIKSETHEEIQIEAGKEEITSPIHLHFSKYERTSDFVIDKSSHVALLDADKIRFPLTLRHWQHGDRFRPLGMKGSKLLSDFFVDQKFTDAQKEQVLLLVSAENEILWIVGYRIDDRYKVTSETKTIFQCSMVR